MVDSHATSNPAISDVKRGKNRIKTESLSMMNKVEAAENLTWE